MAIIRRNATCQLTETITRGNLQAPARKVRTNGNDTEFVQYNLHSCRSQTRGAIRPRLGKCELTVTIEFVQYNLHSCRSQTRGAIRPRLGKCELTVTIQSSFSTTCTAAEARPGGQSDPGSESAN